MLFANTTFSIQQHSIEKNRNISFVLPVVVAAAAVAVVGFVVVAAAVVVVTNDQTLGLMPRC